MGPVLHERYSARAAVAAFGTAARRRSFCDGQFVVLPSAVLCFFTVGPTEDESHVASPSHVNWRPEPGALATSFDDWLPAEVREVWDESGGQIRQVRAHHLFLRPAAEGRFVYAGDAHLGSCGSFSTSTGEPGLAATFSLNHKLPRDIWIGLGGYPGWLVEVNHKPHRVAADDRTTFVRLVGQLKRRKFSHLYMTRYEADSLTIHTNPARGWLMYLRHPSDSGVYVRDGEYRGPPESEEVFRCGCGIALEFPTAQTLSRERAAEAAVEFFQSGQLPRCVTWDAA